MSSLRELQADVLRALYGKTNRAAQRVVAHGLDPQRRLDVYRNNLLVSLGHALEAVYPTIVRLVGPAFFSRAAHEYIHEEPPTSGNLHDFGAELPRFLASYAPAAALPYLADVARLDWAWHAVYHSEPAPASDAAAVLRLFARMPPGERAQVRLRLQPAARLVASRYPVFRIWQANLEDDPPAVSLDEGAQRALVAQRDGDVIVERIGAAEHALLAALGAGATLGDALAAALAVEPRFDAAASIARHLQLGTLLRPQPQRRPA